MKAIILSAGRGSRLLPLTEARPKCLLPVGDTTVLGRQLDTLEAAGVTEVKVVTGFLGGLVTEECESRTGPMKVTTMYNPFYQVADNLASCWMVREDMTEDFLLINGDTLFEASLVEKVIATQDAPVQITINRADEYDSDDMKVSLDGARLTRIGKSLTPEQTHAESIGMLRFSEDGPAIFREKLEQMMLVPEGVRWWFLKAIDAIAQTDPSGTVGTCDITGHRWAELDTHEDYDALLALFGQG